MFLHLHVKIFSAAQIRQWDAYTIRNTPILSIDLMENAAAACCNWLTTRFGTQKKFTAFCGTGNNGGDGLAIARLLISKGCPVHTYIINHGSPAPDFTTNLERLQAITTAISFISTEDQLPVAETGTVIIEAIFGTGISRPVTGIHAAAIDHINKADGKVIAIDMPAGLYADKSSLGNTIVKAAHTISFGCYKLAFLMAENEPFTGEVQILDIGLSKNFAAAESTAYEYTEKKDISPMVLPRNKQSHKGNFGKALIAGGSTGKMGAMVLSAGACLRSGVGLLTVAVPAHGDNILQIAVPEAMTITAIPEAALLQQFTAIGAGPGWGTSATTQEALKNILEQFRQPLVLDADALNCLALNKNWLSKLPVNSILTPHPKEFDRLFGSSNNDFDRLQLAIQNAMQFNIVIVLKGHYTAVVVPDGHLHFNSTGNPGMATGGSGDVLTGIITGLLAQGYSSKDAAVLGVYLHGLAGDCAAIDCTQQGMKAGDIIHHLGAAWRSIINNQ